MLNRYKVFKIVEFVKSQDSVFDTDDVVNGLNAVLAEFGLNDEVITDAEYYMLIDELLPVAERNEFSEVVRLTMLEKDYEHLTDYLSII